MGQAKRRGTYEQRVKQATAKTSAQNLNLNLLLSGDLKKFCESIGPQYAKAYVNNPIMTNEMITEIMSSGLPRYQQEANLNWLKDRHRNTPEQSPWYYEQGDTLFAKKGEGWTLIAGGLKEMGVFKSKVLN